jgi:hypothetical protein
MAENWVEMMVVLMVDEMVGLVLQIIKMIIKT